MGWVGMAAGILGLLSLCLLILATTEESVVVLNSITCYQSAPSGEQYCHGGGYLQASNCLPCLLCVSRQAVDDNVLSTGRTSSGPCSALPLIVRYCI